MTVCLYLSSSFQCGFNWNNSKATLLWNLWKRVWRAVRPGCSAVLLSPDLPQWWADRMDIQSDIWTSLGRWGNEDGFFSSFNINNRPIPADCVKEIYQWSRSKCHKSKSKFLFYVWRSRQHVLYKITDFFLTFISLWCIV